MTAHDRDRELLARLLGPEEPEVGCAEWALNRGDNSIPHGA